MKKIIMIMALFTSGLYSAPRTMKLNSIMFQVGEKNFYFEDTVYCSVETRNGTSEIVVALFDETARVKLTITARVPAGEEREEMRLSTNFHNIAAVLSSPHGGFMIYPAVSFQPSGEIISYSKSHIGQPVSPEWKGMTRSERIAKGKGVSIDSGMEGTSFYLNLIPIFDENNEIREFAGSFSGTVKHVGKNQGRIRPVSGGEFRIGVMK